MMKKITFKLFLTTLLTLLVPITASSQTYATINGIKYELDINKKEAYVAANGGSSSTLSGNITIPATVKYNSKTYNVVGIDAGAFLNCKNITNVIISSGVKSIGTRLDSDADEPDEWPGAFQGCKLESVTIPSTVQEIGERAFYGCQFLNNVIIPNGVSKIEDRTFYNCIALSSVTIPSSVVSIGEYAFYNSVIESVTLSDGVTIGSNAFNLCRRLNSITIPDGATVGGGAFRDCWSIETMTVGSGVTGSIMSVGMTKLKTLNTNSDILSIEDDSPIETLIIGENCNRITSPFGAKLNSVTICKGDKNIDIGIFSDCTNIKTLNLDCKNVKAWFSASKTQVESLTLGENVETIANSAFSGFSKLTELDIPNNVTSIGNYAFQNCSGITSLTLSNGLTSIPQYAFDGCSGLESLTIPNNVTTIGSYAFSKCYGLTQVTIPSCVTSIGSGAFSCGNLTAINVESNNGNYDSRGNCNAIINKNNNTLIAGCKNTVIPNSVTSIGSSAFYYCSGLTSVTIPNSVTSIGENAFRSCSELTSINIPNSVTSIGNYAFDWCSHLTSVTIPNSVTSIGYGAFEYCKSLNSITIPNCVTSIGNYVFQGCSGLTSFTIPNSVTKIGKLAFYQCSGLTSVTIPNSVTSIGEDAFRSCSSLTSVTVEINTPLAITVNTFSNRANASLYVPASCKSVYEAASYWNGFKEIIEIGKDMSSSDITIDPISAVTYNGSAQTPTVTVKDGSTTLTSGTHYTVAYSNNTNAGTATVTITGMGNYTGTKSANFTINPKNASNLTINSISAITYTGSAQTPTVTVRDGSTTLTNGTHYTVAYSNNTNAGTATVTITGMGNYTGTKNANFTINPKNASNLTINSISARTYTGSAQTPTVTVKDGSTTLTSGTHYTVAYSNNTNAGTATVTITGMGNYTGTKNANFTINPKNASNLTINSIAAQTYNGSAKTPTVTVKDGSTTLTSGTHYTVAYSNNTNVGTATVTITGMGNYTGTKNANFTINPKNASNLTINSISARTYTGSAQTPTVTVKDGSTTLTSGTHYTVAYSNNTNAGTATVTITGMGNYTGTKNANFTINPKNASNLTINSIAAQTYSGSAKTPTVTVRDGSTTLTSGTHYTVSYSNNTNAGTATVTVSGKGNYTGTKNASFTIQKVPLTITAGSYTINQKDDLPEFEVEYSGFVNGEDESVLTTQPILTCDAENSETVGTYDITPSGASATNYSFNYVKGTLTVNAVESVTIAMKTGSGAPRTMIGYSSQYNLDFTGINDVKAYIVIGFTDTKGVLMARVNVVPANTGIVLKSDVAGVEVEVPTTTSDMYYANLLKPAVKNVTIYPTEDIDAVNYTNLMVGKLANEQMGFVTLTSSKAYSNKCYLQVPTAFYNGAASAREGGMEIVFVDDETTDIRSLMHNGSATNDAYYDLQGRKVTPVKKGIYIKNGKKVIVK